MSKHPLTNEQRSLTAKEIETLRKAGPDKWRAHTDDLFFARERDLTHLQDVGLINSVRFKGETTTSHFRTDAANTLLATIDNLNKEHQELKEAAANLLSNRERSGYADGTWFMAEPEHWQNLAAALTAKETDRNE